MKKIPFLFLLACLLVGSCGPYKHAINVEMRHPSKAGVEIIGKNVSVVYLENSNPVASDFCGSMAQGFAGTLEEEYGMGRGVVDVYRMRADSGADYASKDSLFNILMDTGADMVFLFDTVKLGNMTVGAPSKVAYKASRDSSYLNSCSIPVSVSLYCFDGMDKSDRVQSFEGTTLARPSVYSDGTDDSTIALSKAWKSLVEEGVAVGNEVSNSFRPQWKHEQYSVLYFETEKWYEALYKAEEYDWKGAMDIWIGLLDSNDIMKRSCAAYNISVACYMLGDYHLATEWLDLSDRENKLSISDALRKRINARIR